ncbi:hypothetical protein P171DRAFT_211819 [Karstenula rhodostoma CBS 690.94]|uniref:Uncharacterized protein n=1 Tax=Karstenula rhodostoma CBS 690.94 TaxID=1392251 RepID=A0A9P4PNH2_9PLEO|nr:hypothetical protein P171DRAFT_211819 [Karstenula rhodostoma CBS 690.94]
MLEHTRSSAASRGISYVAAPSPGLGTRHDEGRRWLLFLLLILGMGICLGVHGGHMSEVMRIDSV